MKENNEAVLKMDKTSETERAQNYQQLDVYLVCEQ